MDIIPVVIEAEGLMKKNLKNYLESNSGSPSFQEIQNAAVKGTVTILKRTLGFKENNA